MNNDRQHNPTKQSSDSPGDEVHFPGDGAQLRGLLWDGSGGTAPGVVLIPDVHGISPLYQEIGASLARTGLRVLVLDIYSREGAPTLADLPAVEHWIAALPDRRILSDIATAAGFLASAGSQNLAVLGFCLGGQYAIMSACRIPQFSAAVSFYGMLTTGAPRPNRPESPLEMIVDLGCPLLGHYGTEDALIPETDLDRLAESCDAHGRDLELHRYRGAGHAFLNRFRAEASREDAARAAWARTLTFLNERLRAQSQ